MKDSPSGLWISKDDRWSKVKSVGLLYGYKNELLSECECIVCIAYIFRM